MDDKFCIFSIQRAFPQTFLLAFTKYLVSDKEMRVMGQAINFNNKNLCHKSKFQAQTNISLMKTAFQ